MTRHNLPLQPTSFIGRATELSEIVERLQNPACRLVSIIGHGGMGKTRLALQVAASMIAQFTDGVFLVPLQAINNPENIIALIASSLDFQFYDGTDTKHQLLDYLANKHLLIIMDNFEHVLDGVGIIPDILLAAPQVKFLVTSREVLNLRDEWLYPLAGMPYPKSSASNIENYQAVQLFVERAQQVRKDFSANEELSDVVRITRLVEGLPLAIELAVTWLKSLSCGAIADEIEHNLSFLTTSLRDVPERHRSMQVVFAHSWNMLSSEEQSVFMKLTVFQGGCTWNAAEAVTGASLMVLSSLVDKSFIRHTASDRYEIHELMRQYGEARLKDSSEPTREAHCNYYLTRLSQLERKVKGDDQLGALNDISSDFENIRTAWEWAVKHQHFDLIDQALECFFWFFVSRYRLPEGVALFQQAIENQPDTVSDQLLGRLLARVVHMRVVGYMDINGILAQLEQCMAVAEQQNNQTEVAFCLITMGEIERVKGSFGQAFPYYEQALSLYRQLDDYFYIERTLQRVGYCHLPVGNFQESEVALREGLELARRVGDQINIANCLYNLGSVVGFANDFVGHESAYREALAIRREMGERAGIALNLGGLAIPMLFRGEREKVVALAQESLNIANEINHLESKSLALAMLGLSASLEENYAEAQQLLKESLLLALDGVKVGWAELGFAMVACGQGDYVSAKQHLRIILDVLPYYGGYYVAPCLIIMALIMIDAGNMVYGIEIMSWLLYHPNTAATTHAYENWALIARVQSSVRNQLGEKEYIAAWERGKTLDYNAVVTDLMGRFASPKVISDEMITNQMQAANQALISPLTRREYEILLLIAQGLSNREVAKRLVIEVSTVKRHINNCYGKLDVTSRTQAIIKAQKLNLI